MSIFESKVTSTVIKRHSKSGPVETDGECKIVKKKKKKKKKPYLNFSSWLQVSFTMQESKWIRSRAIFRMIFQKAK